MTRSTTRRVRGSALERRRAEGNIANSGPITDDYADIINPGTTTLDEEFAGTGGTGSIEKSPGQ